VDTLATLQKQLARSPGLQEAKRQKVSRERLRLLSPLPEPEIKSRIPGAEKLTVIALRRRIEGKKEAQVRAAGKVTCGRSAASHPPPARLPALVSSTFMTWPSPFAPAQDTRPTARIAATLRPVQLRGR
jgi:hypothetical protein